MLHSEKQGKTKKVNSLGERLAQFPFCSSCPQLPFLPFLARARRRSRSAGRVPWRFEGGRSVGTAPRSRQARCRRRRERCGVRSGGRDSKDVSDRERERERDI